VPTHEVLNQPPPLEGHNVYGTDVALIEGIRREGAGWAEDRLERYGEVLGRPETIRLGVLANRFTPELRTHDRYGHRIDEVEFHPAWHELMSLAMANELHNLPWRRPGAGANVARSALNYLHCQVEAGSNCPITMTYASMPTLRFQSEIAEEWEPRVLGTVYDPRPVPASQKPAVTIGMAMTEKQGGSDVRANTTKAVAIDGGGPGGAYELTGHKWFCSAPMCDAFSRSRTRTRGCRASSCRAGAPTARATRFTSSASRTSSAIVPTLRARSSTRARGAA
jgi:putative acyl-CoA dehydrogenase